ncbi:MAG: hypothetical protein ABMA64_30920 [Myxococcota bacterium]
MWVWLVTTGRADPPVPVAIDPVLDEGPELLQIAPEAALAGTVQLTGPGRSGVDLELHVDPAGELWLGGARVGDDAVEPQISAWLDGTPGARVVVSADPTSPYEPVARALRLAGGAPTALVVDGLPRAHVDDPLFPGVDAEVEPLDGGLTGGQSSALRPRRGRFPQDPYANTASYTAYTLEPGETRLGPASVTVGLTRRLQVGTAPLLDVVGAVNGNLKANVTREGPLDLSLLGQYYYVPLGGVLTAVGAGDWFDGRGNSSDTAHASYLGLGATASVQLARPWSVHGQLYWARPGAKGAIAFDDLPEVLLPGLTVGDTAMVGLGVTGDLGVWNLATDWRFNRRDSVFAWVRYPFYGRVRGLSSPSVEGLDAVGNADFIVAYGDTIRFDQSYSVAFGYQGSWKHVDARVGWGFSAVRLTWVFQAFELSYKFGGETRRTEARIRRGYGSATE